MSSNISERSGALDIVLVVESKRSRVQVNDYGGIAGDSKE